MDRNNAKHNILIDHKQIIAKTACKIMALYKASIIKLIPFKDFNFVDVKLGINLFTTYPNPIQRILV